MSTRYVLSKKTVLITGGTGSFGKAMVRHILEKQPDVGEIRIFSRDELKQEMNMPITG